MSAWRWRAASAALLIALPASGLTFAAPANEPALDTGDAFVLQRALRQGVVTRVRAPAGTTALTLDGAALPLADDGMFLLAFDRDARATATLRAERGVDSPIEATLTIAPGNWRIQHVDAPYRGSATSDAEFVLRRTAELAQIETARRTNAVSDGWRQDFIWPVRGRLSGFFGSQRIYQGKPGSYHSGLDIAAPAGTPFVAPADGVVVLAAAQPFTLEGYLLLVDHGMGLTSAFLHASRLDVVAGQIVRQGQTLGAIGATGRATGPHLHWGLRWRSARLDPLSLLPN